MRRDPDVAEWLVSCRESLGRYFDLEDPTRLEPADRELYVESLLDSRLLLRGIVDRVDVAPDGAIRIVDYKTGRSPREGYEGKVLFQLKFYALVLWRTRGVIPRVLQLVYLGNTEMLRYEPDEHDLLATERKVEAIWRAIRYAEQTGDWRPRRSALCGWCAHQATSVPSGAARPRRCRSGLSPTRPTRRSRSSTATRRSPGRARTPPPRRPLRAGRGRRRPGTRSAPALPSASRLRTPFHIGSSGFSARTRSRKARVCWGSPADRVADVSGLSKASRSPISLRSLS